ncbi:E3 ubiquitin protein ligase DRIP2-like [Abrus precatorius]|uniref:E3 ubiquitin protein ligase DRIP2-like n=1 Tax=Abrus precatorius TaxID=3816 RepID=A0A8B8MIP3_ABRPR|nr:E3 ubiquitin protein ligase DRIP2-like [Abrus precatorius]XP_027367104.1 E3 ubiquitin protein ligase DRIP2-like [Abrus precatorius]
MVMKRLVRVKREAIAACMTCPLCNKLLKDATAISLCLHTFCRKCIYDKITDEELESCPVCDIDLGIVPLEKMRPDNSLQDLRNKIFPLNKRKVNTAVAVPSVLLPARRKERSLSSLVVSTPRVSTQSTMTGRRTKPTRKASTMQSSSFSIEKIIKKEEELLEDRQDSSSSPNTSNKSAKNNGQSLSPCKNSQSIYNRGPENVAEPQEAKLDLWKPLNYLVEAASRSKSFKSNVQVSDAKQEPMKVMDSDSQVLKAKNKENKRKAKFEDAKISVDHVSSDTAKTNKLRRVRPKKEPDFGESRISPQAVLDATDSNLSWNDSIWFSLVASENQEGDAPLPQICSSYVRIKNGSMPVSFIQKLLMKKLDLKSEDEVEIKCMGHPVVPSLQVQNLIELWVDTASTGRRIPATIGSSGKDFVMILTYGRKVLRR